MADLDSLQIKVNASAADASKSLDKLIESMERLRGSLSIDTQKLQSISTNIRNLSDAATGFKGGKSTELTSLSRALKSFNGIDTNSIHGISSALRSLTDGLSGAQSIDVSGITSIAGTMAKLGGKNASIGVSNLLSMKDQLAQFVSGMNSVGALDFDATGLASLIGTISKLGYTSANNATKNLPTISAQLQNFVCQMNKIGELKFDMTNLSQMVVAISKLGSVASGRALTNIPKLAIALKELMTTLSTAPQVSQNLIQMTNALAALAKTGSSAGRAADSLTKKFNLFGNTASSVKAKSTSLAAAIGKVYATYWMLFRAFGKLGEAIDISSSLTEVENVVRQTFGRYENLIDDFAKTSIKKFGMSELSAKQFASRFQAMGMALDIPQKQMAKMSVRLTALTGDMASFYDVAQEDVAKSLQSIFSGTTMPMRRYGVDLTQATLNEWLMKQGIDANVKSMSQAQKAMVRYQYTLQQTQMVTGDFQRTSTSWHNTLTMLHENFKDLGKTVGTIAINAFKPFLRALNVVIQKVNSFVETVTSALGAIFGWKFEISNGGASDLADDLNDAYGCMDDLSDAADSASGNTGGIAKNAKKAKKEIQQATRAFDELKTISKQNSNGSTGSGNSGGSGNGSVGKWVETPTKYKEFESSIKDLEGLGKSISGALINAIQSIKWDDVYAKASGFGSGLAKFLNGLFEGQKGTTLFGETGRLIANSLNTVLHGLNSFGTTFDWKQFGNSIADGINKFFQNFDFALLAQTLNTWAQGAFDAVTTAIKGISWKDVWNGAKEFLSNLDVKTIAIIVGALTIKKILGLHLAKAALDVVGSAISKAIAGSIASKLGVEIAANQGISSVLSTALSGKIKGALATLGTTISAGFKALFGSGAAESALAFISPLAKAITGIGSVAAGAFTAISNFVTMLKNGFSWLNEALMLVGITITAVGAVILGVAAAPAAIVAAVTAAVATVAVLLKDNWRTVVDTFSGVGNWFNTNVITPVVGFFKGLYTKVSGFFKKLWKDISGVWGTVSGWFSDTVIEPIVGFFQGFSKRVKQVFQGLWIIVQAVWKVASGWFNTNVIQPIKNLFTMLGAAIKVAFTVAKNAVTTVWKVVSNWFSVHVATPIKNTFNTLKSVVSSAFSTLWAGIKKVWESASGWFTKHVTTPVKNAFSTMANSIKNVFSGIWKSITKGLAGAMNAVIGGIESGINFIVGGINKIIGGFNKIVSWAAKVAEVDWGGVDLVPKVSLSRISIKGYEAGGFPDKYSLFMGGEHGKVELLGTVGGKTAVAGGQEITGIKDAINSTSEQEMVLLRQQNQLLQAILQKQFGITTSDIGRAAREYGKDYYNRTGNNAYVF